MTKVSASSSVTILASACTRGRLTAAQQRPAHRGEALRAPAPGRPRADARAEQHPVEARRRLLRQPDERPAQPRAPERVLPVERPQVDAEAGALGHPRLHRLERGPQLGPANRLGLRAAEVPYAEWLRLVVRERDRR